VKKRGLSLFLLLVGSLVLVCFAGIDTVNAENVVYIRPNGSVEGTDKILRDGMVYTLTDDISAGIYVQKKSITLDGGGYTLHGEGDGSGIDLNNGRESNPSNIQMTNVVVKNFRIENFRYGLNPASADNCSFIGNYIGQCTVGITFRNGDFVIKNNTFDNTEGKISIGINSILKSYTGEKNITENNFYDFSLSFILPVELYFDNNYYSNYSSPDKNGDGICDTPYVIYERKDIMMGSVKFVDEHPHTTPIDLAPIPEFPSLQIIAMFFAGFVVVRVLYKQQLYTPKEVTV
jgi:hypothetical protein